MIHAFAKSNPYPVRRPAPAPAPSASSLLLLEAGLGGFVLLIHSLLGGEGWQIAWLAGAGGVLALWAARRFSSWHFGNTAILLLAADALCFVWRGPALRQQMLAAGLALLRQGDPPAETDALALVLCLSMALLLGFLELGLRRHGTAVFLLLALLCLLPLLGARPGLPCVLLLGGYALAHPAEPKRNALPLARRTRNACAGVAVLMFLLAGAAGAVVAAGQAQPLFAASYDLEGAVRRTASRLSGADQVLNATGQLNRGNLYPTGAEHLRVWSSEIPTEPLYLAGFAGGDYTGRGWAQADEERDIGQVTEVLGWDRWGYMVDDLYDSMFFMLRYLSQSELEQDAHILYLHPASAGPLFLPYYSRWAGEMLLGEENWYSYLYYASDEMQIDWEAIPSARNELAAWYAAVRQAYAQAAAETYTRLPENGLTRLRALVAANPQPNVEAVTSFILGTLHSQAVYTTTPGYTPLSEDYAEYFLFTSHQGYCQQFATAATLLYRLYGIPARYATGYVAQPSDFAADEEGGYTAVLTDASAHAWVEIWLPDYGWTPVEATPSAAGSAAPEAALSSGPLAGAIRAAASWQGTADMPQILPQANQESATAGSSSLPTPDATALPAWGGALATPLAAALLLGPLWPDGVRALRRRRLLRRGPAALLAHLLSTLDWLLPDRAPVTDHTLPDTLAVLLPALPPAEVRRFVALARQAQFARPEQAPTSEETAWALTFCRKVQCRLAVCLPTAKRLLLAICGIY